MLPGLDRYLEDRLEPDYGDEPYDYDGSDIDYFYDRIKEGKDE
jgi:hypothetical protein